jgi:hypothetical protein
MEIYESKMKSGHQTDLSFIYIHICKMVPNNICKILDNLICLYNIYNAIKIKFILYLITYYRFFEVCKGGH